MTTDLNTCHLIPRAQADVLRGGGRIRTKLLTAYINYCVRHLANIAMNPAQDREAQERDVQHHRAAIKRATMHLRGFRETRTAWVQSFDYTGHGSILAMVNA